MAAQEQLEQLSKEQFVTEAVAQPPVQPAQPKAITETISVPLQPTVAEYEKQSHV